jgi:hypothetical protein
MNPYPTSQSSSRKSAYYSASIGAFLSADEMAIIGILANSSMGAVEMEQIDA